MKEKCNKYESFFIFSNDEEFKKHVDECETCRIEHKKLEDVSKLIKEAYPLFLEKEKEKRTNFKIASGIFLVFLASILVVSFNFFNTNFETLKYGKVLCAEDYGFPVDSYGLIMVDE